MGCTFKRHVNGSMGWRVVFVIKQIFATLYCLSFLSASSCRDIPRPPGYSNAWTIASRMSDAMRHLLINNDNTSRISSSQWKLTGLVGSAHDNWWIIVLCDRHIKKQSTRKDQNRPNREKKNSHDFGSLRNTQSRLGIATFHNISTRHSTSSNYRL